MTIPPESNFLAKVGPALSPDWGHWPLNRPLPSIRANPGFKEPRTSEPRHSTPRLASAFYVRDIPYRWERGVRYPLAEEQH